MEPTKFESRLKFKLRFKFFKFGLLLCHRIIFIINCDIFFKTDSRTYAAKTMKENTEFRIKKNDISYCYPDRGLKGNVLNLTCFLTGGSLEITSNSPFNLKNLGVGI